MMLPAIRFVCDIAYRCSLLRFLLSGSYLSRCLAALEQASDCLLSNTYSPSPTISTPRLPVELADASDAACQRSS
jgi:hypothetical protein